MNSLQSKHPKAFSGKKVSVNQALTILNQNGIQTDQDQAKAILEFLYHIAKTHNLSDTNKIETVQA